MNLGDDYGNLCMLKIESKGWKFWFFLDFVWGSNLMLFYYSFYDYLDGIFRDFFCGVVCYGC